jgi:regulation of enolase protein 1 (concanavalin A-like superfamily)
MEWYNEPQTWRIEEDTIVVTADPQTDFWRKTHDGGVRDNGHFYFQPVSGDFTAEVKFQGKYAAMYDHAGLMVRLDATRWLKCGVEYVDGMQYASAVVTRDYSDWSVVPLPQNPSVLWLRVTRHQGTIEVHYSLDGAVYTMARQAHLTDEETLQVGPMCAAPKGNGFAVTFEDFTIRRTAE